MLAENLVSRQAHIDSITLTGHTDRLGSEQYNYNLGLRRAQTVKDYLQGKGVQAPISVASAGESQPVTTTCTGTRATAALKACLPAARPPRYRGYFRHSSARVVQPGIEAT